MACACGSEDMCDAGCGMCKGCCGGSCSKEVRGGGMFSPENVGEDGGVSKSE